MAQTVEQVTLCETCRKAAQSPWPHLEFNDSFLSKLSEYAVAYEMSSHFCDDPHCACKCVHERP